VAVPGAYRLFLNNPGVPEDIKGRIIIGDYDAPELFDFVLKNSN